MAYEPEEPVRRRRRGRWALLVVLLILVGLVVIADRVGASIADQRLTDAVVQEAKSRGVTAASTDVTIGGFPFLTQVLRGRYEKITIDMSEVRSGQLKVHQLLVNAFGVKADTAKLLNGNPQAVADTVTGTAVVDWATLPKLADYAGLGLGDASFAQAGKGVRIRGTVTVLGQSVPLAATATFSVSKGAVQVKVSNAQIEGITLNSQVQSAVTNLEQQLSIPVNLPALPFGLKIDSVLAQQAGLSVTATAKNVPIAS